MKNNAFLGSLFDVRGSQARLKRSLTLIEEFIMFCSREI